MRLKYSKLIKYTLSSIFLFLFLLIGCHRETETIEDIQTIIVGNNQNLEVKKTDRNTTSIGIITNHNYGTTHNYSYELTLNDDIYWYGGSHEPKQILFDNTNVYLRYLHQKRYSTFSIDTLTQDTISSSYYKVEEDYQKHIDERYFFNWFGKDYWVNIDSIEYYSLRKGGQEFEIPNDGELSL